MLNTKNFNFPFFKSTPLMNGIFIFAIIAVIIFSLWFSVTQFRTNEVQVLKTNDEFSADQSMQYWEYVAKEPRTVGSVGHERSKYFIISRLQEMGLVVEIQKVDESIGQGKIENIIARIPGTSSAGTILLTTHYDSIDGGADGSGTIAALLETVRVITSTNPLKNDIILLFSDGKDYNLLGAKAFSESHRFANEVDIVLNFETRATQGPSILFEANDRNENFMTGLIEMTSSPTTHSFLNDIHKILPMNTELSVYQEHGMNGLTISFFDDQVKDEQSLGSNYPVNLSFLGANMLEIVRHFGNVNIVSPKEEQVVYFNMFGNTMVTYNEKLVTPLMELAIILFIGTIIHGIRKKQFTLKGITIGMLVFILILPLAYFTGEAVKRFVTLVVKGQLLQFNLNNLLLLSIGLIVLSTIIMVYSFLLKKYNGIDLTLGSFVGWLALVIISSTFFKGSSYVFVWPFIVGLVGLNGLILLQKKSNIQKQALSIAIVFLTLVFTLPIVYLLYTFITLEFAGVLAICFSLIIAFMIPALSQIDKKYVAILPMVFLVVGIASLVINFTMNI